MKVIFQKPDLDTCLTALIFGVSSSDEIIIPTSDATEADIMNPDVLCIEAGGSGLVHLNNFDHHNTDKDLSPACLQAYTCKGFNDEKLKRLVEYVCMVDNGRKGISPVDFPSLSNIFSGMLLVEKDKFRQFFKGMEILNKTLELKICPFSTMPDIEQWRLYKDAKIENHRKLDELLKNPECFESKGGCRVGFVESDYIGGIGAMYARGCDVVVMFNPAFGGPPSPKYTIASQDKKISHLLTCFDVIERGWGGRETIIGSPRSGTKLKKEEVLALVLDNL